jgi:enoyl-CoA hydratase/carnithine racemase
MSATPDHTAGPAEGNDVGQYKVIEYEVDGRSAVIRLNRPDRGNAWTGRLHAEYLDAITRAEADAGVRTVVVTGNGWAFCVGGDSEALSGHADRGGYDDGLAAAGRSPSNRDESGAESDERGSAFPGRSLEHNLGSEFNQQLAFHYRLTKPVIAAINGPAAGIGLALACFADLRFAVPGAKLTTAHGKLGLPPEYGLSWILPRHIGLTRAMDLLLTSRAFTTDEANEMGLINQLLPPDELVATVLDYAENLATTCGPAALQATRHMVYLDQHRGIGQSVAESLTRLDEMMGTPEYRQGVNALRNKQPPSF